MTYISAYGMVNALGNNLDDIARNLQQGKAPGLQVQTGWLQDPESPLVVGRVLGELPPVPPHLKQHDSRNNRLLLAALAQIRPYTEQAIRQYGHDRVAVIMGTSTSGLDEGDRYRSDVANNIENSHWHYAQQELGDPSRFLRRYLNLSGPAYTLSTACSSSARAIISGIRLIQAGLADVALVGGADSLSRMPVNGFNNLESLSPELCQPFACGRQGITIGEAGGLMLLTRDPQPLAVLGFGESTDAYHISAPHPEGEGAIRAITMALSAAQCLPQQVGYINLHGTATPLNDAIESKVIHELFKDTVPCSSTKHLTGHTLGSAGITEAGLCALIMERGLMLPAQDFHRSPQDGSLPPCGLLTRPQPLERRVMLSNSFAFGGNNTCLILGDAACLTI
ncbi:beta-ketoacyl-[acyl-carrier-protein] synthase family protein [Tatumella sp. UBA2305]|uniref:beta-ketoacyl-[acyl-carrier-protein] synthase family protein n=1 Tax=Tatumella sp. UBA2305 TaxID=1947647 RepID=UPI0025CE005D|nr:beta-ketoacyl-[acyl-carrier-protein] synthase family protein [Tatumella sp. UBA2305]